MALVANTKDRGNVYIADFPDPRRQLAGDQFFCPACGSEMIIVAGMRRVNHFRHKVLCTWDSQPESFFHLEAKRTLYEKLKKEQPDAIRIDMEFPIEEVHRIADIRVITPYGSVVHEIQLSSITVEEIERRTHDYYKAGFDVIWWIGGSADKNAITSWIFDQFGAVFYIIGNQTERNSSSIFG